MTASLSPGRTPKYSVWLAARRIRVVTAVGLLPIRIEQIASVDTRISVVVAWKAELCVDPPLIEIVWPVLDGNFAACAVASADPTRFPASLTFENSSRYSVVII